MSNDAARLETPRRLFMVLSPRSLPYARLGLESLFRNSLEKLSLTLITDSESDKIELVATVEKLQVARHTCTILSLEEIEERESQVFGRFNHLREFRHGHPCWRKITDPLLLSKDGEEIVILDPDLYFPNRFRFEQTPNEGVLLMWQKPSCLFPPEAVETAMEAEVPLAHHVDIGVAHWRPPTDFEWLNWLIGRLGGPRLPHSMHVEAIVWAALAMKLGGGHLNPKHWLCWHRTQYNRALRKLGASGSYILNREPLDEIKCFHAGGEAKSWLVEAYDRGILNRNHDILEVRTTIPFVELKPSEYMRSQHVKLWLRRMGYYSLFDRPH